MIAYAYGMFHLTPFTQEFFSTFWGDSMSVSNKVGKRIFMKFSAKDGYKTMNNPECYQDVAFNPLDPVLIFYFRGSVFVSNIMENAWMDSHEIFMKCQTRQKEWLAKLFHGIPSWRRYVPVCNITVNWMGGFSWNCQDSAALRQEQPEMFGGWSV